MITTLNHPQQHRQQSPSQLIAEEDHLNPKLIRLSLNARYGTAKHPSSPIQSGETDMYQHDNSQCSDDLAASILSEAKRNAQAELKSTSEILKLAGVVLRDRAIPPIGNMMGTGSNSAVPFPVISASSHAANSPSMAFNFPDSSLAGGNISPSSRSTSPIGASSLFLPIGAVASEDDELNNTIPEYSHLPGKFGSLSAEDSLELTNSPINRTQLLSKLDGLESCTTPRMFETKTESNSTRVAAAMDRVAGGRMKAAARRYHGLSHGQHSNMIALAATNRVSPLIYPDLESARLPQASHYEMMPLWLKRKVAAETEGKPTRIETGESDSEYFGQYEIYTSDTIITHEFNRGNWTWVTEWSPDGKYLALATENHDLAIVEAGMTTPVWKVILDGRIGKLKNDTTHTLRSIAWGGSYIALGGTGDAVTIIEPCTSTSSASSSSSHASNNTKHSFRTVDVITETGFVGTLHWQKNSNILAIGNREDQCLVVDVRQDKDGTVNSHILHNIERSDWVNAVKFSPGGTKLAIGDRSGLLSVFLFVIIQPNEAPALSHMHDVTLDDNILDIQWSPDAKFVYAGGEDYCVTIIDTSKWDILQKIARDRWVPFLAPSRGGSILAAGGGSSSVSLFDVRDQWKEISTLPLGENEGIPLSAKWHPKDQYLSVSGQCKDIIVYETSSRRLLEGKCLCSKVTILAVEFSPNGKMLVVGNEEGTITFFDLVSPTFITLYETVIGTGGDMTIRWSPSGKNVAISSGSTFVLLDTIYSGKSGKHPQNSSRFLVRKVIQGGINYACMAYSPTSDWIALTGNETNILDVKNNCSPVRVIEHDFVLTSGWAPDGAALALVGEKQNLCIYDSRSPDPKEWAILFSLSCSVTVTALCWGPSVKKGLQYLAFSGADKKLTLLELRTFEKTWETVLQIPKNSVINDLDWNDRGLLCLGDDDGTTSVIDLSYLKSGRPVNEMNYNWQRQGIICTMKLTRNLGRNAITSLRWLQSPLYRNNRNLLVCAGSDGILEIVDLSERNLLEGS